MVRTVKVDLNMGGDAPDKMEVTKEAAKGVGDAVESVNRKLNVTAADAAKAAVAMKLLGAEADGATAAACGKIMQQGPDRPRQQACAAGSRRRPFRAQVVRRGRRALPPYQGGPVATSVRPVCQAGP